MNYNDTELLIKLRQSNFKGAKKKIANFILNSINNKNEIKKITLSGLANSCNVSSSTVLRFCKNLGFSGFTDFKSKLIVELNHQLQDIHEKIKSSDDIKVIQEKVGKTTIQAVTDSMAVFDEDSLNEIVDLIIKSNRIEIFGVGTSNLIAQDLAQKLLTLRIRVKAYTDSHMQINSATLMEKNDLAFGISHSGLTKQTINCLKAAKQAGATTVCLTNTPNSEITNWADYKLYTASRDTLEKGIPIAGRSAQFYIIDTIYASLALKTYPDKWLDVISKSKKSTEIYRM